MQPITAAFPSAETTDLTMLEAEARALSSRRRDIHAQIDQLYLAAPLNGDQIARLDRLEEEERTISSKRRALHRDIDERRWRLGLPAWTWQRWRHDLTFRAAMSGGSLVALTSVGSVALAAAALVAAVLGSGVAAGALFVLSATVAVVAQCYRS